MVSSCTNPYLCAVGSGLAVVGAVCDLRWRRIPNRLTAAALVTAFVGSTWNGGVAGLLGSLAACLLAGTVFGGMFFMGGMGGGDVKLMAVVAGFAGLVHLPQLLLATTLAGGVFAVPVAAAHGALGATVRDAVGWLWPRNRPRPRCGERVRFYLPYGVPIAVGALLTFSRGVIGA